MKKMVLGICLLLTAISAAAQKVFTAQELRADLTVIRQALEEAHPGLYRYRSKEEVDRHFTRIGQQLKKGMTEHAFFRLVNPLIAAIGDGHIKFHRQGKPDDPYAFFEEGYFPLQLYFREGQAFVLRSYSQVSTLPAGVRILSINREPISRLTERLSGQLYADGNVSSARYAALNNAFAGHYGTFTGAFPKFTISYKEQGGKRVKTVLKSINAKQITTETKEAAPYALTYPAKGVALLRIAVFMEKEGMQGFAAFLDSSFGQFSHQKISTLIIDLRDNEGGTDKLGQTLYAFLARSPFRYYEKLTVAGTGPYSFAAHATFPAEIDYLKQFVVKVGEAYHFTYKEGLDTLMPATNAFGGNVYILQNGRSFSVTAEFAAIAKDNRRAVFIGEESGGAMQGNSSGGFAMVTLPHTRLGLDVPLLGYYMKLQQPFATDRGIPADHIIIPSAEDILQRRDPVMEKALQLAGAR
ncbi:S41 family peptidase [Chitinophaga rhizophila]|uniref:Tail specific protease domain-containing protein n=1 Tax=Chitinophaga rhizophila TaxID=2866212 RepID=A0ABS7G770_9BACT|nr:S41 family peptidase [Chitinophaga rhizophila]MBW8683301.1 hypothetical protein [Chitinophaga rhizophila]